MSIIGLISSIILIFFAIANFIYFFIAVSAFFVIFLQKDEIEAANLYLLVNDESMPKISFIIPSYNDSNVAVFCVQILLNLNYRNKEIIFVDDGSNDDTLKFMKEQFKLFRVHFPQIGNVPSAEIQTCYKSLLYKNLVVIRKKNASCKADADNAGLNMVSGDFSIVMDADTLIDSVEMDRLIRYVLIHPEVEAFGASIRVINDSTVRMRGITELAIPKNYLAAIQVVEYLRCFLIGRVGWNSVGGPLILSGAFSIFRTSVAHEMRGYNADFIGEDLEFTLRFKKTRIEQKRHFTTGFLPQAVAWTEVPENIKMLGKQRTRWHIGLAQVIIKHKKLFMNPKYKILGLFVFPFYVLFEFLAPLFELLGYIIVIMVILVNNWFFPVMFFGLSLGITIFMNIYCITMERLAFNKYSSVKEYFLLVLYSVLENIGYRQLTIWWRLKAFPRIIFKNVNWDIVVKKGFFKKK